MDNISYFCIRKSGITEVRELNSQTSNSVIFPHDFTEQMRTLLHEAEWLQMQAALEEEPVVSIRLNNRSERLGVRECGSPAANVQCSAPQGSREIAAQVAPKARGTDIGFERDAAVSNAQCPMSNARNVPWCSTGFYLDKRPNFTLDPCFHAGAYYVQEASSMFVEQAVRHILSQGHIGQCPMTLDLCAAPGGKSTLLRSLLPDDALMVCNEPVKARANVLRENIIKWGHEGCFVSCNYPRDFVRLGPVFDVILVDAPCSGEGMFRRDNPALGMWSTANVMECVTRQRDIVKTIWPTLKPGGYLIYSTCTYNTQENEENVRCFCSELGARLVEIPTAPEWNITGSLLGGFDEPVYRFMPHKTKGEGFFLALLKKEGKETPQPFKRQKHFEPLSDTLSKNIQHSDMVAVKHNEIVYAVRPEHAAAINRLIKELHPMHVGVALCETKGRKLIPHHSLAMSRLLAGEAYPTVNLTYDTALTYLRHETIHLDAPRGYVLVAYNGLPLGFVNNLGPRANNLYPMEWRIRQAVH